MREETLRAWMRVYDSGQFILGEEVEAFEREVADYLEVEHAIGVSSGTAALELILKGFGITGEVLVPALTFIGTAEAVVNAGATPVFTDVDSETWTMTWATAEPHLTARTEAVIPVHLFGNPAPIAEFPQRLFVIEDACQAFGSTLAEKFCGSLGDAAAFSFYPSKNLPGCGDGGCVTTNGAFLADRIRDLRHHQAQGAGTHRLDELQAAALRVRLANFDRGDFVGAHTAQWPTEHSTPAWHRSIHYGNRPEGARTYYDPPLHLHPSMARFRRCELPVSEAFAKENWCA